MKNGPLEGIRVLEIAQFIAAPGAGAYLSDLGADVIKIESPQGDGSRLMGSYGEGVYAAYNRGKRSVSLDLRTDRDRRVLARLVPHADVVLHALRRDTAARFGLAPEQLRSAKADLIVARLSGFGTRGPYSNRAGFDISAQAESGMLSLNGERDGEPLRIGFSLVDAASCSVLTAGILAALLRRERTGEGDVVDVSLMGVGLALQGSTWAEYGATREVPRRRGNGQPSIAPAGDVLPVKDGHIVLSAYIPQHWARLCDALDLSGLIADPRFGDNLSRVKYRDELLEHLSGALSTWTMDECVSRLEEHGIVVGAVRAYPDVLNGGWAAAERAFDRVQSSDSEVSFEFPRLPFSMASMPDDDRPLRVPRLGEHTLAVLEAAGMEADDLEHRPMRGDPIES